MADSSELNFKLCFHLVIGHVHIILKFIIFIFIVIT